MTRRMGLLLCFVGGITDVLHLEYRTEIGVPVVKTQAVKIELHIRKDQVQGGGFSIAFCCRFEEMLIHSEGETVGLRIVVGALVVEYGQGIALFCPCGYRKNRIPSFVQLRSEEHTSELQSRPHLVCRLL